MQQVIIYSQKEFDEFISSNRLPVVYFSTPERSVCKVIKPKLIELLNNQFRLTSFGYVNCDEQKHIAAQLSIFAVPTIFFYAEGKEFLRESRNIDLLSVEQTLSRIYKLIFE